MIKFKLKLKGDVKKTMLKDIIKGVKDGKGGPGTTAYGSDASYLAPYKNAYYKRMKASNAFSRIAKITGLGDG